jgi:hypothetical protein
LNEIMTKDEFAAFVRKSMKESGLEDAIKSATPEERQEIEAALAAMFGFNSPMRMG